MKWTNKKANEWYQEQSWLVGCNFLPSSAINQLEMFQEETSKISGLILRESIFMIFCGKSKKGSAQD